MSNSFLLDQMRTVRRDQKRQLDEIVEERNDLLSKVSELHLRQRQVVISLAEVDDEIEKIEEELDD